jgi:hypothetical protein
MPRKSAAANLVHPVEGPTAPRLKPPAFLKSDEQRQFTELVADNKHLTRTDVPMLASYVRASAKVAKLARSKDVGGFVAVLRAIGMIATKLRLTAQSNTEAKTVARQKQRDQANDAARVLYELNGDAEDHAGKPWETFAERSRNFRMSSPSDDDDDAGTDLNASSAPSIPSRPPLPTPEIERMAGGDGRLKTSLLGMRARKRDPLLDRVCTTFDSSHEMFEAHQQWCNVSEAERIEPRTGVGHVGRVRRPRDAGRGCGEDMITNARPSRY